jgi:hypothetical protein
MDLKLQLQSLQKGHLTMQSYIDHKCSIADKLRLIGSPVFNADLQMFILHGLNMNYDSLVISLTFRSAPVPFKGLTYLLLTHEQRLHKYALATAESCPSPFPATLTFSTSAFPATPQANIASSFQYLSSAPSLLGPPPSTTDLMNQFNAFLTSKGAWHGKIQDETSLISFFDRLQCQLCFKKGHTADRCYKRFDATYKPHPPRLFNRQPFNKSSQPQALFVKPSNAPPDT